MKDERNREMMRDLYRLVEQYEETPVGMDLQQSKDFFWRLDHDVDEFWQKWKGLKLTYPFGLALIDAREDEYTEHAEGATA